MEMRNHINLSHMYFEHQTFNSNISNTKTDSFVEISLNNEKNLYFHSIKHVAYDEIKASNLQSNVKKKIHSHFFISTSSMFNVVQ